MDGTASMKDKTQQTPPACQQLRQHMDGTAGMKDKTQQTPPACQQPRQHMDGTAGMDATVLPGASGLKASKMPIRLAATFGVSGVAR